MQQIQVHCCLCHHYVITMSSLCILWLADLGDRPGDLPVDHFQAARLLREARVEVNRLKAALQRQGHFERTKEAPKGDIWTHLETLNLLWMHIRIAVTAKQFSRFRPLFHVTLDYFRWLILLTSTPSSRNLMASRHRWSHIGKPLRRLLGLSHSANPQEMIRLVGIKGLIFEG